MHGRYVALTAPSRQQGKVTGQVNRTERFLPQEDLSLSSETRQIFKAVVHMMFRGRRKQPQIPTYLACTLLLCPGAQPGTAAAIFSSCRAWMFTGSVIPWDCGYGDTGGLWRRQGNADKGSRGTAKLKGTRTQGWGDPGEGKCSSDARARSWGDGLALCTEHTVPANFPTPMARSCQRWSWDMFRSSALPPVLLATCHSRGPRFPETQRLQRFQLRYLLKIESFSKPICWTDLSLWLQKLSLHQTHQLWTREARSPVPDSELHVHASNRQLLKWCSHHLMSHPLPSLAMVTATYMLLQNSKEVTAMPPPQLPSTAPGTETALLSSSSLPAQSPQQPPETCQGMGPWPSCPEQGGLDGCISHHVSGSLALPAQSCLCAYRQKHR